MWEELILDQEYETAFENESDIGEIRISYRRRGGPEPYNLHFLLSWKILPAKEN